MAEAPAVDRTLDCKGLLCPMPIVKLSKLMKELESGQVVLMEATDPGSIPDVEAYAKNTGNPLLTHEQDGAVMRFWLQKG
jgi:tRNA 2-thiouridine synthesizing protein A